MNVKRPFSPTITIGDQPTEADLAQLKNEGYKAVVNLRNDGEPEQPMSTADEGAKVRALGMDYLNYGVGAMPLSDPGVTSVCDFIDAHSQGNDKVLVHCRKGGTGDRAFVAPASPSPQMDQGGGRREREGDRPRGRRRAQGDG